MIKVEDLRLGQRVRDAVTGIEGIITCRCDTISGYSQFGVQGPAKDGTPSDVHAIDWQAFEILSDELVGNVIPPENHDFGLGDVVMSIDTGAKGTIVRLWTYINGCVHAALTLPLNSKGEPQDTLSVPVNRLELFQERKEKVKPRPTAGPPTRCPL